MRALLCCIFAVALCGTGCRDSEDKELAPQKIQGTCEGLAQVPKKILKGVPRLGDLLYSPFELPKTSGGVHRVTYEGAILYVPARVDVCVPEYNSVEKHFGLIFLNQSQGLLISINRMVGRKPMDDVFQIVGDQRPGPERVAHTRKLFGKAPTLFDILDLGWQTRASDFSCDPKNPDRASRDAVALIIKSTAASDTVDRVHRNVGFPNSQVIVNKGKLRRSVDYHFAHGDTYYTLSATGRDDALVDTTLAWLPSVGKDVGTHPAVKPWDPACLRVISFVAKPSVDAARTLTKTLSADKRYERVVSALDAYINPKPPPNK